MKKILVCITLSILLIGFAIAVQGDNSNSNGQGQNQDENNSQIQNKLQEKNRLKIGESECPENCTCSGSTTKCQLADGTREMTISAGNSGNIIIQVKGENMSTKVTLYHHNGKVYGNFSGEEKEVKVLPDRVKEKIKEKMKAKLENYNITLDENGMYLVQTKKKARLFYIFPVREKTSLQLNSEDGEPVKVRNPWWGFLARDIKEVDESE